MKSVRMVKDGIDEVNYKKFVEAVLKDLRKYKEDATMKDAEDIAAMYSHHFYNWKEKNNGMEGYPMEYELRFIVWNGIHEAIEKVIERKDVEAYVSLKEVVEYYNENFVLSGNELERILKKLESLSEEV